jgi:predicted small integral membrane protein
MVITRISKIAIIAALAAYALIVAYDNIIDYGSNYEFVKHVLTMDMTFAGSARAPSPTRVSGGRPMHSSSPWRG